MNYFFSETPLYGVIVSILLFIKDERKFKKYNKNMIEEMKKDLKEEIDFWNKKCEKKNSMKESLFFLCNKFDVQIFFEMEDSFFRYGNGEPNSCSPKTFHKTAHMVIKRSQES